MTSISFALSIASVFRLSSTVPLYVLSQKILLLNISPKVIVLLLAFIPKKRSQKAIAYAITMPVRQPFLIFSYLFNTNSIPNPPSIKRKPPYPRLDTGHLQHTRLPPQHLDALPPDPGLPFPPLPKRIAGDALVQAVPLERGGLEGVVPGVEVHVSGSGVFG